LGHGGQHIFIIPDLDIVTVITADEGTTTAKYFDIIDDFVVSSVID
jgi:hypothetical protein